MTESRSFTIDEDEYEIAQKWLTEEVYPEVVAIQKEEVKNSDIEGIEDIYEWCWQEGFPYMGAIGGGTEYCFMPTGLGPIKIVRFKYRDKVWEKNVTNWDRFG